MRTPPARALWRGTLALALVSCTADRVLAPTGPNGPAHDVVAAVPSLVITELMADPTKVADGSGEWFEVHNAGSDTLNLRGYKIVSAAGATSTESHTIAADVMVAPGEYAVLGNNANAATNGGAPVDYSYGGSIALNNGSGTSATEWLAIRTAANVSLDSVAYAVRPAPGAAPGPYSPPSGASRALLDLAADNTVVSSTAWTTSTTTYGVGDRGTPGQPNVGGAAASVSVRFSWVTPGTSFRVSASAVDKDGKPSPTNFTWSSDNTAIATIDAATGNASGVAPGIATITATASNGVAGTGPLFVVNPGEVASVSVDAGNGNVPQMPAGFTKPLFASARTTDGPAAAPALVWSSADPGVATVDALGYVTGVAPGRATISATAPNGVYNVVTVTVDPGDAPTTAVYRNNLELGRPADATPDDDVLLLDRRQFAVSYNPARGGPNWVSWELNASQFGGIDRCDCFTADPALPAGVYHVVDYDYRNGGYDRGHMAQSASRASTAQENARTFLLSNILPQAAANNQGPWSQLENALNDSARAGREVYVVAGGIYAAHAPTLKNEGKVAIPDYTWKVAVIVAGGQGLADVHTPADLNVIAVRMPNLTEAHASAGAPNFAGTTGAAGNIRNTPWPSYRTTVDEIERQTGYDLLDKLPDQVERLVESNDRAPVAAAGGPYSGVEGGLVRFDAGASRDPDGDALTYAWDFGDGTTGTGAAPEHAYRDDGSYTATVTVTDPTGVEATATAQVTIANEAPSITQLSIPAAPLALGSPVGISLAVTDPGDDSFTTSVDWDDEPADGATTYRLAAARAAASGSCAGGIAGATTLTHRYARPGLYTIRVTVCDDDGGVVTRTSAGYVVVVDPDAGFVTGGGWIPSPSDRGNFGFVVRYERGAAAPTGSLQFHLNGEALRLTATSYDWLVVNPGQAQYKGQGTIDGRAGTYGFFVTAVGDGARPDRFRIKITDAGGAVVFDNAPGDEDSSASTALGGGRIDVKAP